MTAPENGPENGSVTGQENRPESTPVSASAGMTVGLSAGLSVGRPDIDIRQMTAQDIGHIALLERELFGLGAWSQQVLTEELTGWGRWYIVAQQPHTGQLVGYAGVWFDGDVVQIMTLGVAQQAQGQGLGRAMMQTLLDYSSSLKASAVLLEVAVDNDAALSLYRSLGFELLGLRKRYYQPQGTDAYTMRLTLTDSALPDNA